MNDMFCGNGSERTAHPVEWFGEDWMDWQREEAGPEAPAGES